MYVMNTGPELEAEVVRPQQVVLTIRLLCTQPCLEVDVRLQDAHHVL